MFKFNYILQSTSKGYSYSHYDFTRFFLIFHKFSYFQISFVITIGVDYTQLLFTTLARCWSIFVFTWCFSHCFSAWWKISNNLFAFSLLLLNKCELSSCRNSTSCNFARLSLWIHFLLKNELENKTLQLFLFS